MRDSPPDFREGPGRHADITPEAPWFPGKGEWQTDWAKVLNIVHQLEPACNADHSRDLNDGLSPGTGQWLRQVPR